MVLDNADDLDMFFAKPISPATESECALPLTEYLPRSVMGLMLITTRDERLGGRLAGRRASIVVDPMSPQEAQELLENWGIESPGSPDLDHSSQLLEALGYIPLAITQAAAFISENHVTPKKYLEAFRRSDSDVQDLLDQDLGDLRRDSQSHNSVIKTWKMSFDLISKQKQRAAEILSLMAVLDRQGIPETLLQDGTDRDVDFTTALGTLLSFSLIKAGGDEAGYELHQLVQLATRKWLEMKGTIEHWQEKALSAVANAFPVGKFKNWPTCESLLPHAQTVIKYGEANEICPEKYSNLLADVAYFDREQGRYEMACVRGLAAIDVQKKLFGSEDPSTLLSMSHLASTYQRQGHLKEAEKLDIQVLESRTRLLGAEHSDTLQIMNNLGVTYEKQGHLEEAEKLHLQVLEAAKRVLGVEHSDTLRVMNNLAVTYARQGRWDEAGKLNKHVLETKTRVLGAEHPDTLSSMNNLAVIYQRQGRWDEAEKLHLQVLEAEKRVLGAEHPDTVNSMDNLAFVYRGQGRHSEAIALMESVIDVLTKTLGPDHPDTKNAVKWLKEWLGS